MTGALQRASLLVTLFACQLVVLAAPADGQVGLVADGTTHLVAFDTATNQKLGSPISVGLGAFGVAITPDARTAYATNIDVGQVRAVDVGNRQVIGQPITVGGGPEGIAITPDGNRAYVATNGGGQVAVIDTQNNFVGPPITVGTDPRGIAITPDGRTAYVTNFTSGNVSVADLVSNQTSGSIPVGTHPFGITITPDGNRAYVTNEGSGTVSVINIRTNQIVPPSIPVGEKPRGIAIAARTFPFRAYVANEGSGSVSVIDTQTNQVVGPPIVVGSEPTAIAFTADGSRAYVTLKGSGSVVMIDTTTNQVVGPPIVIGGAPQAIAITPAQAPIAAFSHGVARPGVPVSFDAHSSRDPDGSIAQYDWYFGDLQASADAGPTPQHVYPKPGRYPVTLTVTDEVGCSKSSIFGGGQTEYCNGSAAAGATEVVTVAYPAVRVKCPKRAGRRGCRLKLTAVTKRRKGKAMTKTARARIKAGRSRDVSLIPKSRFAAGLATADRVLVREKLTINGSVESLLRRLPILPPPG